MTRVYALDHRHDLPLDEVKALVGGKAANLGVMASELGLPVPPGFAITTATCREFLATGWPDGLDEELAQGLGVLERVVGRRFGDPDDPLLVSVRSGAPVSMPGMMDTILNLGLTSATAEGLARVTGDAAFARDCRARLQATFGETVGRAVPDEPAAQFRLAIEAVFRSWDGERARAYRAREGIADDLGTGVVVQAMVFGNRGPRSATGVVFTRNPATGEPALYGDVLFGAQGEDVVAGTHRTEPIAVLDERLPDVAAQLRGHADRLERHFVDLCDIEFTIEEGRLSLLQVRVGKRSPQAALRIAVDMAEDPSFPLSRERAVGRVAALLADPPRLATGRSSILAPIASGLPASPGVASGEIVTSAEAAVEAAEVGRRVILVRTETSPDDVHGMARAAGILTARGGLASHAAVVARGWGIPAVVGTDGLDVEDGEIVIGGRSLPVGAVISIDGASGEVFEGEIPGSSEVVPEAATLLAWAGELGIAVAEAGPEATGQLAPSTTGSTGKATVDDCIRSVAIKGFATVTAVAEAMGVGEDTIRPLVDDLAVDGLVATTAGAYRLTDAGKARAAELRAADRDAWGAAAAVEALEQFHGFDLRMKEAVTAWQLREGTDPPEPNDHTDAAYDAGILARLEDLDRDAAAWLASQAERVPRLRRYQERLAAALERALAGDGRYVASPRVDSYHGIWFELHEDLIGLAGRTREDEAAAGRA